LDQRRGKRVKRRITCELVVDGKRQAGIVLDVSASGLFVQTAVTASVGKEVEVHLAATRTSPELTIRARVARGLRVPSQLLASAGGGLGLRVLDPPPAYAQLVGGDEEAVPSQGRSAPAAAAPQPKSSKRIPVQRRFRVRLQATGSTRSRLITVQCPDAKTARTEACKIVGPGWDAVEVSEQP
jgi:hypothetical protein